ncbi:hypothetical protein HYH03_012887 [Edaphochlamys debaryana]|uniref:Carbonic anhydrase n=1 Tax=Edaphochlamys debaryana TaxID=47281 RepID=A0A835XQU4_9CHLO|nr:hypothetical protein HYH03_012887 [Edaphochlamys debaryana]|eukprot:KAG2488568.1 hypothetical protein HYH03_012887 [Edaphochlamys debaryana]
MPRPAFARSALTQIASAFEANVKATEPLAEQLLNVARPRMMSTVARTEGSGLLRMMGPGSAMLAQRSTVLGGASAIAKSCGCPCGRVACMGACSTTGASVRHLHAHPNPPSDPEQALEYLREGNKRFVSNKPHDQHPTRNLDRVKATAGGQKPFAAFLSCADSRVPVEIIFDQGFGDVFVTRVAGNIVTNEITASLEFGTAVLGSKVLMVLGHSACGAVAATMAGAAVPGVISSLYYSISPACKKAKAGDVDAAIAENVRVQMEQLKVSPVLQGLVKEGKLKIVGGVYDLATGKVVEIA